jgi:hypothetical protein
MTNKPRRLKFRALAARIKARQDEDRLRMAARAMLKDTDANHARRINQARAQAKP